MRLRWVRSHKPRPKPSDVLARLIVLTGLERRMNVRKPHVRVVGSPLGSFYACGLSSITGQCKDDADSRGRI
jgi:hypothetical protein